MPAPTIGRGMTRRPGERWPRFAARIANAFGLVLLLVVLTYILSSLTAYHGWTAVLTTSVATASATVALASAKARPFLVRWGGRLSVVAVILAVVAAAADSGPALGISALIQMLLLSVAALAVLRAVLTESEVGFRTILGAVSVYLILALLFSFLYVGIERLQSGPFFAGDPQLGTGDYVFFSITTLTTTGYGNLVPAAQPGKMFSGLEMLVGQIFVVTLISGLVSLWRPGKGIASRQRARQDREA
jgi:Ion channel